MAINCDISQEGKLKFGALLAKRAMELKGPENFDLQGEIQYVHDIIYERYKDREGAHDLAMAWAREVPNLIRMIFTHDADIRKKIGNENIASIFQAVDDFAGKDGMAKLAEYLGAGMPEINEDNVVAVEEMTEEEEKLDKKTSGQIAHITDFYATTPTFFTTNTGIEFLDDENIERNPDEILNYKVLRKILPSVAGSRGITFIKDGELVKTATLPGGKEIFLRAMKTKGLELPGVKQEYSNGDPVGDRDIVLVVVDNKGNPILFDNNANEVKSDGQVATFTIRDTTRRGKEKLAKDYKQKEDYLAKLISPTKKATFGSLTKEQKNAITKKLDSQLNSLDIIQELALNHPSLSILLTITGGSSGAMRDQNTKLRLADLEIKGFNPEIDTTGGKTREDKSIYSFRNEAGETIKFQPEFGLTEQDKMTVKALLSDEATKKDGSKYSAEERKDMLHRIINTRTVKDLPEEDRAKAIEKEYMKEEDELVVFTKDFVVVKTAKGVNKIYTKIKNGRFDFNGPLTDISDLDSDQILDLALSRFSLYHIAKEHVENSRTFWYPRLKNGSIEKVKISYRDWAVKNARFETTADVLQQRPRYGTNPFLLFGVIPDSLVDKQIRHVVKNEVTDGAAGQSPAAAMDSSLQSRMTTKIEEVIKPSAKKYLPKEKVKTVLATQFIGRGVTDSSTERYRKMYDEEGVANTGQYTAEDVIFVSSNGNRQSRVKPVIDGELQGEYKNITKAMKARASFIMDTPNHLAKTKKYNIGEIALAKYMEENGYKRKNSKSGLWVPTDPGSTPKRTESNVSIEDAKDIGGIADSANFDKIVAQKTGDIKATPEQIKEAEMWWKTHLLSGYVKLTTMFNMINSDNPKAIATWTKAGITLYQGADWSDTYHEAWHAFSQMFLTKAEREELYNAVRKQKGSFTDYNGTTVEFNKANDKQIEEYLAENFREYVLSKGTKIKESSQVKKNIFQRIYEFLKKLFGFTTPANTITDPRSIPMVNEMYEKLRVGNINTMAFNASNASFGILNKTVADVKTGESLLNYKDSKLVVDTIDSLFSELADSLNDRTPGTKKYTTRLYNSDKNKLEAYKLVYKWIQDKIIPNLEKKRDATSEPNTKANIQRNIDMMNEVLANFGDTTDLYTNARSQTGVIYHHMLKSDLLSREDTREFFDNADLSEEEAFVKGRDSAFDRGGNDSSLLDLASQEVITAVRSIKEYDINGDEVLNELGVVKRAQFMQSWNFLAKNLEGKLDIEEMWNKLRELAINSPIAQEMLNKLGETLIYDDTSETYMLQTNFWQAFNKYRVPLVQLSVKKSKDPDTQDVNYEITVGETHGDYRKVQRFWDAEFNVTHTKYIKERDVEGTKDKFIMSATYLDIDEILKDFDREDIIKDPHVAFTFARAIGINLSATSEVIEALDENVAKLALAYTHTRLQDLKKLKIPVNSINDIFRDIETKTKNLPNQFNRYNDLAKIEAKHGNFISNFMVSTAEGTTQFEHSLNSSMTTMVSEFNNQIYDPNITSSNGKRGGYRYRTFDEIVSQPHMRHLHPDSNPYVKELLFYKSLFNEDGTRKKNADGEVIDLTMENISGASVIDENSAFSSGVAAASADPATRLILDLHNTVMRGSPELMKHADKKSSFTTHINEIENPYDNKKINKKKYIDDADFIADKYPNSKTTRGERIWNNTVSNYVYGELVRMRKAKNLLKSKLKPYQLSLSIEGETNGHAWYYIKNGEKMVMFEDVIPEELQKSLSQYAFYKPEDVSFIEYLEQIGESDLADQLDIALSDYFNFLRAETNELLDKYGVYIDKSVYDDVRQQTKIKVDKGVRKNRVGKDSIKVKERKDAIIDSYIANSWIHNIETMLFFYGDLAQFDDFHKRNAGIASPGEIYRRDKGAIDYVNIAGDLYAEKLGIESSPISQDGSINTAVMEDSLQDAVYLKEYRNALKKEGLTEEAIDQVLSPYENMEEGDGQGWITLDAYRKLLKLQGIWTNVQEKLYKDIIKDPSSVNVAKVSEFFPVKKVQYWGPVVTDSLPAMAMHKFSLMPLIPGVSKNLDTLHNRMMKNNIHYSMFKTASKVQDVSYGLDKDGNPIFDKFYSENKERVMENEEKPMLKNRIFLHYLKDQINTSNKFKSKVTFPTQLRKLLIDGLTEQGYPIDFMPKIKDKNKRRKAWQKLSNSEKIKKSDLYKLYHNYERIIDELTELKYQELLSSIDWKLDKNGKPTGDIKKLGAYIMKSTEGQLAAHELDIVQYDKNGNLKYDLSLSFSSDKIEKLLNSIVIKKIVKQKVTGEPLVQVSRAGWEVRASKDLPFYRKGKDGKTLAMKVKIAIQGPFKKLLKHQDVIKRAEEKEISRLEALNQLLKEESWVSKNKAMITIVGARIPVQGLNSMDFMEVYEFLPEIYGNIIVAPSEIVAKSGSDFDIDKLFTMMPNIIGKPGNIKLPKYKPLSPTQIQNRKDKLQDLHLRRKDLTTEYKRRLDDVRKGLNLEEGQRAVLKNLSERHEVDQEEILSRIDSIKHQPGLDAETKDAQIEYQQSLLMELEENYKDQVRAYEREFGVSKELEKIYNSKDEAFDKIDNDIYTIETEIAEASSKALENELFLSMRNILETPENFVSLITPNSTDIFYNKKDPDSLANRMEPYADSYSANYGNLKKYDKPSKTRTFEIGFNLYKQKNNSVGMQVLGIGAIDNTFNSLFNRIGMRMNRTNGPTVEEYEVLRERYFILKEKKKKNKEEQKEWLAIKEVVKNFQIQTMMLNHNKQIVDGKEVISLSNIKDVNEVNKISDIINQMINGWVDVAKDTWVFNVQGNKELAPILLFMVQSGVDVEEAVYLLTHPIVQEYVELRRTMQSTFSGPMEAMDEYNPDIPSYQAKRKILSKYGIAPTITNEDGGFKYYDKIALYDKTQALKQKHADVFTKENLRKRLDISLDDAIEEDSAIFAHFLEIENMANNLKKLKMNANPDTKAAKTLAQASKKQFAMDNLMAESSFPPEMVEKLSEDTVLKSFFNTLQYQQDIWDPYFSMQANPKLRNKISKYLQDPVFNSNLSDYFDNDIERFLTAFINDFKTFVFQRNLYDFNLNNMTSYKGVETAATPLEEIPSLRPAVAYMDGKLYYDKNRLNTEIQMVKKGKYAPTFYPFAPVYARDFTNRNGVFEEKNYIHYVFERETLREVWPVSKLENTFLFKEKEKALERKKDNITDVKFKQMVYEDVLKDMAMNNIYNLNHAFEGKLSIADQLNVIKRVFPELLNVQKGGYQILNLLGINKSGKFKNLKLYNISDNSDDLSIFYEELQELMDPDKIYMPGATYDDKRLVSNFFKLLPVYAVNQTGFETGRMLSIQRIMPDLGFREFMTNAKKEIDKLSDKEFEQLVDEYQKIFFSSQTKKGKNRYKDYGEYAKSGKENSEVEDESSTSGSITGLKDYNESVTVSKNSYRIYNDKTISGKKLVSDLEKLVQDNPNTIFVFNDTVDPTKKMIKNLEISIQGDWAFKLIADKYPNVVGLPTRSSYSRGAASVKDKKTQKAWKERVDNTIEYLMDQQDNNGMTIAFSATGYGQHMVNRHDNNPTEKIKKEDKTLPDSESFTTLSSTLFSNFGYINPNFRETGESSRAQIEAGQTVTSQDVIDKLRSCFYE